MAADTRGRMIDATVRALRRQGVAGMSFTEVLRDSGAARGAIYHHFPGGKAQLVGEAVVRNGEEVLERLSTLPTSSAPGFVAAFFELVRPVAGEAAAGGGCAVAAVALGAGSLAPTAGAAPSSASEADGSAPCAPDAGGLLDLAEAAFQSWTDGLAAGLAAAGLARADAADLATTLITLLEGAQILCRAARSLEPFEQVVRTADALVRGRYATGS